MSINNTYPTITPKNGMKFVTSGYGNYNITIEDLATYVNSSSSEYVLPPATTEALGGVKQAVGVEDSDATELIDLRNSFNELLANLRASGIIY